MVHRASLTDAVKEGRLKLGRGDLSGIIPIVQSTFFQEGLGADYTKDVEAANDDLGLKPEALEDLVRHAIIDAGT